MLNYFLALQACYKNNICDMATDNQALSIECTYMTALLFPKYHMIQLTLNQRDRVTHMSSLT